MWFSKISLGLQEITSYHNKVASWGDKMHTSQDTSLTFQNYESERHRILCTSNTEPRWKHLQCPHVYGEHIRTHSTAGRKRQIEQVFKVIRLQLKSQLAWGQVCVCVSVCGFLPQLKNKKKPWGNQRCTVGGLISLLTRRNKPRTLDRRSFPSRWAALETRRIRRKKEEMSSIAAVNEWTLFLHYLRVPISVLFQD